jgi:hypothetical protein
MKSGSVKEMLLHKLHGDDWTDPVGNDSRDGRNPGRRTALVCFDRHHREGSLEQVVHVRQERADPSALQGC